MCSSDLPDGRIIERDIQKVLDAGLTVTTETAEKLLLGEKVVFAEPKAEEFHIPATAPAQKTGYTDEKMSQIRRTISKSMHTSLTELAQLTLSTSFDASALVALRASLKAGGEAMGIGNITYNDMILFAVAKTLATGKYKALNANLIGGDTMRYFEGVHLGIAEIGRAHV